MKEHPPVLFFQRRRSRIPKTVLNIIIAEKKLREASPSKPGGD